MTKMSYKYFCTSKRVRFWMHHVFKFYSRKITKIKSSSYNTNYDHRIYTVSIHPK